MAAVTHRRLSTFLRTAPCLLAAAAGFTGSSAHADDRWATLQAIHTLENPYDVQTPGPDGELGPYQFREATWRRYTAEPFSRALDRDMSDAVAIRHYEWLKRGLARHGLPATPYNIALAWNGGLSAVLSGRPSSAAVDYAERAANLAAEFDSGVAAR